MRIVRIIAVTALFGLGLTPRPAHAQNRSDRPIDIGAGYLFVKDPTFNFPFGVFLDGAYNLTPRLGGVAVFSHSSKTVSRLDGESLGTDVDFSLNTFLFGVRVSDRGNPRATWFGQTLIGIGHASASVPNAKSLVGFDISVGASQTVFQAGGGVVIPLRTNGTGLRFGVDYRHFDANELTLTAGVNFSLGQR